MTYIASNIRFLRKYKGLSQADLAVKLELNRGNITAYERDVANPPIDVLIRMVEFFEVDLLSFIKQNLSETYSQKGHANLAETNSAVLSEIDLNQFNNHFSQIGNLSSYVNAFYKIQHEQQEKYHTNISKIAKDLNRISASLEALVKVYENKM